MGNAAGSAEQPAGPTASPPKQPAVPKQPMPAAGELEERFTRVLVSVTWCALGARDDRGSSCVPASWDSGAAWRSPVHLLSLQRDGSDSVIFQSDLAPPPPKKLSSAPSRKLSYESAPPDPLPTLLGLKVSKMSHEVGFQTCPGW